MGEACGKWAGNHTSKIKHFGCTTTQRAESGHKIIKNDMSVVQPLNVAFDSLVRNLEQFERDYQHVQFLEKTKAELSVASNMQLVKLVGKVSHRALLAVGEKLERGSLSFEDCKCKNPVVFDLPCVHKLSKKLGGGKKVELEDIAHRWILNPADVASLVEEQKEIKLSKLPDSNVDPKPWMKYVSALINAFKVAEGDLVSTNALMGAMDKVLELKESNNDTSEIRLPESKVVKTVGRPAKSFRKSLLEIDFANSSYRRDYLVYGKQYNKVSSTSTLSENEVSNEKEESDLGDGLNKLHSLFLKRKVASIMEASLGYEKDELCKPTSKRRIVVQKTFAFKIDPKN